MKHVLEGIWAAHQQKFGIGAVGTVLAGYGVLLDHTPSIYVGAFLVLFSAGQLLRYWHKTR